MPADENPGAGMPRHDRHQEPDTPDFELTLPARAENVAVVRHAFGGIGDAPAVPAHALAAVKLGGTGACPTAGVHGNPTGDGPMRVPPGGTAGGLPSAAPTGGPGTL